MNKYARSVVALVAVLLVAATTPQMQGQDIVTLKAYLSGGNEVPGVSTGAHGYATVTLNRTAGTITYEVRVYNLATGITASHIHASPQGVNGPIIIDFTIPGVGISGDFSFSGTVTAGALRQSGATGILTLEDAMFSIASGASYVNVHSQANAGGDIRGQLCPTSAAANTFNGIALCTNP